MDYTGWPQNPNPNPNPTADSTFWYTANHYHNPTADTYQSLGIYSHNASFPPQPQPQPQPPGVDLRYMAPVPERTVAYVERTISYEAQQSAAPGFYYPDPNANLAASARLVGSVLNTAGVIAPKGEFQAQRGNPVMQFHRRNTKKKGQTKTKVVQSAWCDVCKVDCNSVPVLDQHKLGKKHKKNLEKLKWSSTVPGPSVIAAPASTIATYVTVAAPPAVATTFHAIVAPLTVVEANSPAVVATAPAIGAASISLPVCASAATDKPITGPEENPGKPKSSNAKKSRRKAAACIEDLETKRRKVLEGGATAESVRTCHICNVVCNSDTVFNFHLAGQKHASMIKKHTSCAGAATTM